ncbi:histidine kinase dimerization/phospho-acceptor domain-containing protein [Candidatus Neomarinimicrobiota bacterium]
MTRLDFLQEIGGILQKSLSSEETYAAVFDILDNVIEFDSATLFVMNPESGVLDIVASHGSHIVDLAAGVSFKHGEGLSGWVASQKKPVILPAMSDVLHPRPFQSLASIPLWARDTLQGVLNLGHAEAGYYSQDHKDDLEQLGVQMSLIVEQLRLRSELHEKNQLLETALSGLQEAQKTLVEKERLAAIGQFVVKVNHEINNPLSIILGFIDLLEDDASASLDFAETLSKMKAAAHRIKELTQKLEDLKTIETEEYVGDVKMIKLR